MAIKDILLHVDTSPASDSRVTLGLNLARRLRANLTGLFVVPSPDLFIPPDSSAGAVAIATAIASMQEAADALGARFTAMLEADQLRGGWLRLMGSPVELISRHARAADLVILGQRDPANITVLETPEDVILTCGRPVLVVPYKGAFDGVGAQVVVAWNGSREACRAAHDALELVSREATVALVSVDPDEDLTEHSGEIVQHFAHHGLRAEPHTLETDGAGAAEMLLTHAENLGSDLIVMGAYGHSRIRELVLGGMTQDVLRRMNRPVLMAH
jgi:nucleotide-binding universal stress UspA family protein